MNFPELNCSARLHILICLNLCCFIILVLNLSKFTWHTLKNSWMTHVAKFHFKLPHQIHKGELIIGLTFPTEYHSVKQAYMKENAKIEMRGIKR